MHPQIPIEVNADTGVWSTDDLPMLYVPRHFFNNLHLGIEQSLGCDAYTKMLYVSGYKSAQYWCDIESRTHRLGGIDVFVHYLQRLSQRGWGQFRFVEQRLKQGYATIGVNNSSFVLHKQHFQLSSVHGACYMFSGWFAGAADWVANNQCYQYVFTAKETNCAALNQVNSNCYCEFTLSSTPT